MKVKICGCVILAGCLLGEVVVQRCPTHSAACEALGEPSHTHEELPRGAYTVRSDGVQVSNTSPGMISINLNDVLSNWQDGVAVKLNQG